MHNSRIKRKFGEARAYPRYPPPKELRAIRVNYLIIDSVQRMSTTCLHHKSPQRRKGVERAKLYL